MLNNKSAEVDIILKYIKLTKIIFCGILCPAKKIKQASKTPIPLGAAGTIKPTAHEIQKIINKKSVLGSSNELTVLKQIKNPINLNTINPISYKNALNGKKEVKIIFFFNWSLEFAIPKALTAFALRYSRILKIK